MRCIVCNREFLADEHGHYAWGDYDTFMPQYGSRHDMTVFRIFLCDDCIDAKLLEGGIEKIVEGRGPFDGLVR
jgi:hypothetical protein